MGESIGILYDIINLFRHASKDHLLELVTPSRTYYIQADTGLAMKEWIEAFQSVISQARSTKV